ncbi:MAG: hypothetical protein J1E97_02945 [Muribaculaceae bacterium]|nr:hypothetical protein [Muribaculaceae bacterium]
MNVIKKQIPEGVQYLSEWEEFDSLPKHEHYILAKEICGCGATEAFIRSHTPVIIAMPRKHLLYNKYSQHIGDNVFLYRFLNQKQYFSDKKPTEEEIKEFDRLLLDYVHSGGNKILMTFDSLDKATWLLQNEGLNPNQFQVVVDEFQQIIGDAPFKAAIEHQFYQALKRFDSVVYLSATPFLQAYLEMTDQFKGLNMIQLQWPDKSISNADVNVIKLTKSIKDKCCEIIAKFKNGEMPYVFDGDSRIESKEAVFFLNDVRTIIKIVQNAKLKPEEVNILCAPRKENHDRIESLNKFKKDGESRFVRGNIPGKGEPHKMFTFCTSTVYIGADFYSESAYSYIFANPNIDSLTIDVGTDIQQIIGRQRNEHNPFRMKADLYYYLKKPMVTEGEIEDSIRTKRDETRKHIENLQNAVHKDCLMKSLEAMIEKGHKDQYCCLSDDGKGNLTVVENPLIAIAEKRAWDIANTIYSGDLSLIKALQNSVNIVRDVDTTDPDVRRLFNEWSKDGQFKRQAMMYCELREKMPQLFEPCTFIPKYFHDYYDALGREGMESLQWRNDYIREALAPTPQDLIPHDKIVEELKTAFHEGEEYPKDQIKKVLTDIYLRLNIKGKPSACDIQRYFTIQEASKRINGRKTATIRILSHWQKQMTLFRHIADVKKPAENTDIDSVLRMIKVGTAYGLKNKITKLRTIKDLQDFNKNKATFQSLLGMEFSIIGILPGVSYILLLLPSILIKLRI